MDPETVPHGPPPARSLPTFGQYVPRVAPRRVGIEERIEVWAAVGLPGALTVLLAFNGGGYFATVPAVTAVFVALVLAMRFVLIRRPLAGLSVTGAVATVALAGFAAWTVASSTWSDADAPYRSLLEYDRALLVALVVGAVSLVPFTVARLRWALGGIFAALFVVCGAALVARTMPDVLSVDHGLSRNQLSWPLTYWNALGLMAAMGVLLSVHFTCSLDEPPGMRIAAATALPVFATTSYFTFGRGPVAALAVALVVYLVAARPRGLLTGLAATVPATTVALMTASPPGAITDFPVTQAGIDAGSRVAAAVVACAAGAGLVRGLLLRVDDALAEFRLPERLRRPLLVGTAAVVAVAAIGGAVAVNAPDEISAKYQEFKSQDSVPSNAGTSRFLAAGNNGRLAHWEVGIDRFKANPMRGDGAGTYDIAWYQYRDGEANVAHAHSLYVEVLSELGLPGLALLAVGLLALIVGVAWRCRGPNRALNAAVLAAVVAWTLHAGIDWDWEMPATGLGILAVAAMALARPQSADPRRRVSPRLRPALRGAAAVAAIALAAVPAKVAVSEGRLQSGLDRLWAGDCRGARADASASLDAVGSRPEPYQLITWCALTANPPEAVAAASAAVERDPRNWELRYNLAIARAAAGEDPRPAAATALRLNPLDVTARRGVAGFRGDSRREWRAAAQLAPLTLPLR